MKTRGGRTADLEEEFREMIRETISKSGLSMRGMGRAAEVGIAQLSRYLAGERDLTSRAVFRVMEAIGVRLVADERTPGPEAPIPQGKRRPRARGGS
jgi:hypothetical protein